MTQDAALAQTQQETSLALLTLRVDEYARALVDRGTRMRNRMPLVMSTCIVLLSMITSGCSDVSKSNKENAVRFELRDFTVDEKTEESSVSKWNSFSGSGTIATRDPKFQNQAAFLVLQIVDKSEGDSTEPATQLVLLREGLGKIETYKSEYGEMVKRPEYEWTVLGWIMLDGPGKLDIMK